MSRSKKLALGSAAILMILAVGLTVAKVKRVTSY